MILLIDNYDSFVHNLARYVRELGFETRVVRNDGIDLDEISHLKLTAAIVSPGPCTPAEAGVSIPFVQRFAGKVPILGVCLGHQAIAAALGGGIIRAPEPMHGRTSWIRHLGTPIFAGIANPFRAARYHSLIVDAATLPDVLTITASTTDGIPMAIEDAYQGLYGVQFHPESILTEFGHRLIANFLRLAGLAPVSEVVADWRPTPGQPLATAGSILRPVAWPAPLSDDDV